jgi:hypothetical protein
VDDCPGKTIIIPEHLSQVNGKPQDLDHLRRSYLANAASRHPVYQWTPSDIEFLSQDLKKSPSWVQSNLPQ